MLSQTAFKEALFKYENDEETEEDGEELDYSSIGFVLATCEAYTKICFICFFISHV